jgi:peptidoglycan hydrolase-like protein with peptidoglycan-binding domain
MPGGIAVTTHHPMAGTRSIPDGSWPLVQTTLLVGVALLLGCATAFGQGGMSAAQVERACNASELNADRLRELQGLLNELGEEGGVGAGTADGVCGPRTVGAIMAFQERHDMAADGVPNAMILERARAVQLAGPTLDDGGQDLEPAAGAADDETRPTDIETLAPDSPAAEPRN